MIATSTMSTTHLAANLKYLRAARKLSQEQMADRLEVKRSSYSGYETGVSEPNLETLQRMQAIHNVGLDVLISAPLHEAGDFKLMQLRSYIAPRQLQGVLPEDVARAEMKATN